MALAALVALVTLVALMALVALVTFVTATATTTRGSNAVFQPLHLEHARSHHAFSKEMKGIELTGFHRN